MQKLHRVQKEIIKQLTLVPFLKFSEIRIDFVDSELLSYHLRELVSKRYIIKKDEIYTLSDLGKDYSNLTNDDIELLERQPKTSILLRVVRINPVTKKKEELVCKRLRQPYYGKIGRLTGKVQFGESLEEAAKRELFEETGLAAIDCTLERIYHKLRYDVTGLCVQDVIFYGFYVSSTKGDLVENIGIQENFWLTKEMVKDTTLDFYDDFRINTLKPKKVSFTESLAKQNGY